MLEERIVSEGMSAVASGSIGAFDSVLENIGNGIELALVSASTAGQLHVELDKLAEFYNALSALHDQLSARITAVYAQAQGLTHSNAAGHVPGVQAAVVAILESAGAGATSSRSLLQNLQSLDGKVFKHMASLLHNAQKYAAQENRAIAEFGRVTAAVGAHTAAPPKSGSSAW